MLTPEQQAALSGVGAYGTPRPNSTSKPYTPPPMGYLADRPLPGEMGRPGSIMPNAPVSSSPKSIAMVGDFLLIAILGMLG